MHRGLLGTKTGKQGSLAFTLDDMALTAMGFRSITEATKANRSEFSFTSITRARYFRQVAVLCANDWGDA